jgi:hypothetical protein
MIFGDVFLHLRNLLSIGGNLAMSNIHKYTSKQFASALDGLQTAKGFPALMRARLEHIGVLLGRNVSAIVRKSTPSDRGTSACVLMTTKGDMGHFGSGLREALEPCHLGYMDFGGRRGLAALNTPMREMYLPDIEGKAVKAVVVAKAVLATGCTAISLTGTAMAKFLPQLLVIVTIYYSAEGLSEVLRAFPNAIFVLIGEPQLRNTDEFLIPGIGLLDANI